MKKIFGLFICLLVSLLFYACVAANKKSLSGFAEYLALRDELTPAQEAVVWTLSAAGKVTSYWIKNDVTGVLITAWRDDLVIPTEDALWRLENEDADKDYDTLMFRDLVAGGMLRIPLDTSIAELDGGTEDAGVSGECVTAKRQGRPMPLISVGAFLFLKYKEQTISCEGELLLLEDKFVTVDLAAGETTQILTDAEIEALFDRRDVKTLEKEGEVHWSGTVPSYNPAFLLSFVHVFAAVFSTVSEDGLPHSYVNTLEVPDNTIPERLKDYYLPPDLVQAFGMSIPDEILGGFWAIGGKPEPVLQQFDAFSIRVAEE